MGPNAFAATVAATASAATETTTGNKNKSFTIAYSISAFPYAFPSVFHVALQFFQALFGCSFSPFFVLFSTFHYCFLFLIKYLQLLCLFICYALPCPALCHYSCLSVIHYVPDLLPALAVCSLLSLCLSPLLI